MFAQCWQHPEFKNLAPDGTPCNGDTRGLLIIRPCPFIASGIRLMGKETERGWEQDDDINTLMPSLVRYGSDTGIVDEQLRKQLLEMPLDLLDSEAGLSRHTIVRARRGPSTPAIIANSFWPHIFAVKYRTRAPGGAYFLPLCSDPGKSSAGGLP